MIKLEISQIVTNALVKNKEFLEHLPTSLKVFEPAKGIEADISTSVAIEMATAAKRPPKEFADRIACEIKKSGVIEKISTTSNGFLNFVLEDRYLRNVAYRICREGNKCLGRETNPDAYSVFLEFVSANPTGPLHIGHGRGAALGDSLSRIYRFLGARVHTEYYVNDVGIQMGILAKSVEARYRQIQGGVDVGFPEDGYKGEYISEIAELIRENGNTDFNLFPREHILNGIRKDLEDFGITFDRWFYESDLHAQKKIEEVLAMLRSRNVLKESEGALWFAGSLSKSNPSAENDAESDKDRVLRKSDGNYTYFASDVAYHHNKFERGFDLVLDVWGHDHHGYVPRMEAAVQALGHNKKSLKILLYQLVSLKRGGKRVAMSTRAGEFVTLREILDEVGRDACRFFFAMRTPSSQLDFDVDLAKKQSNENPVYYVQYVHARICSIFREAEKRKIKLELTVNQEDDRPLEKEERELILKMGLLEETLEACLCLASPNLLTSYLLDLATRFHRFYDHHRVLDAEPSRRQFRLNLLKASQTVVKTGLELLGVSAPDKM